MSDLIEIANQQATLSVDKIENERIALMNCVEGMEVTNDEELSRAADLLKNIKGRMKWLEEDRKKITDPINKGLRLINAKYKPAYDFLELIAKKLDQDKIVPYSTAQFKKRQEEARLAQEAEFKRQAEEAEKMRKIAEEQGSDIAAEVAKDLEAEALKTAGQKLEVTQTTRTANNTVNTIRGRWVCEIIDPNLVPREYCEPVQSLLNKAATNGVREIAGCKIYEHFSSATK